MSSNAEIYLKEELWGCFKYIKIPFDILYKMPTRERKFYIKRHNDTIKEENEQYENAQGNNSSTTHTTDVNKFAAMSQSR